MIEWCGYLISTMPSRVIEYAVPPVNVKCVQQKTPSGADAGGLN